MSPRHLLNETKSATETFLPKSALGGNGKWCLVICVNLRLPRLPNGIYFSVYSIGVKFC
jgi:hypothetical protein